MNSFVETNCKIECRICGSNDLEMFLDLGEQPWCNDFVLDNPNGVEKFPLQVFFCKACTTVQVGCTVPKEKMYSDHLYVSGTTRTMSNHFGKIADDIFDKFKLTSKSLVFDIGSNDGTLLSKFKAKGCRVLGIDPCKNVCNTANSAGIDTIHGFYNKEKAKEIMGEYGKVDVISAANVFYHIGELHNVCDGIKSMLKPNGVFVIQGSYLPEIISRNEFDVMYHEHLLLYRMETLNTLLRIHGMELFDVDLHPVHGGSFVALASHIGRRSQSNNLKHLLAYELENGYSHLEKYVEFADNVKAIRSDLMAMINDLHKQGKTIYAYGAPAKGTVLVNYCGLESNKIACAVEKNPLKFGRFVPGTKIPILDENKSGKPDYYLLLAWNFATEILKKYDRNTNFIIPFPKPHILQGTKRKLDMSVVIKCKDDYRVLDCIKSIDEEVDVVVSLMPNKDLEDRLTELGVRYVNTPVGNLSITANAGIDAAIHNKVLVMDSDSTFAPGCIYDLYSALELYEVARPKIVYLEDRKIRMSGTIGKCRAFVNEFPLTYTPGLSFKKEIKDKIGGYIFDNDIPWAEDDDLSQRIFKAGIRVGFIDNAIVYHSPIDMLHDLRAAYRIGYGIRIGAEKNGRNTPEKFGNWILRIFEGEQVKEFREIAKVKGISVALYNLLWSLSYYWGFTRRYEKGS